MKQATSQVTMQDVARQAGVSTATVSRVLTTPERVTPRTRAKVAAAALALGYGAANDQASYSSEFQRSVLVLIPDVGDSFYSEILHGLESVALANNCLLFLINNPLPNPSPRFSLPPTLFRYFDGIICLGTLPLPQFLVPQRLTAPPIVVVNQFSTDLGIASVHIDNLSAAFNAVSYLIAQGHTRIASIIGPEHWLLCQYRRQGYIQALRRHNLPIEPRYIARGDFSFASGIAALNHLCQHHPLPEAIFCHNDRMALGVLHQAKQLGIAIPQQLSVIGFDGIAEAAYSDPPLTTMAQPRYAMGQKAMHLLIEQFSRQSSSSRGLLLETTLTLRQSVATRTV